ncbi:hypothetical protein BVRB_8g199870 [Beta vulgaris subsp. vulgaris]|uniref:F-box domain-containing protein n=1 Tax=Beta vulgaris subsp. vulgaris TaxID=3555 RepID=A0A0J8E126_BETVV|nr:putative F-box protein At1g49610 [Beta vulgaris subsp. vulgaris]KMS96805.1 hypothetical protein BVRB_8g199870 [Beta vulgaris subsp. vulgaris]
MVVDEQIPDDQLSGELAGDHELARGKRLKIAPDRLTELPDLALAHILSHLYVEEAAKTIVLSKRFNSVWNSVSTLNFSDENYRKYGNSFIKFVDSALGFHIGKKIEKFSVKFRYDQNYTNSVDEWIKFAVQKQVKSLRLDFTQKSSSNYHQIAGVEYNLPEFLYDDANLVELVTCSCRFSPEGLYNWNCLKLLSITKIKLDEEMISRVLCGCPVLQTLELIEWSGFDKLKIESVSLRVLRIVGEQPPKYHIQLHDLCLLEISGPNLTSLQVLGPLYRTKVRVSDVGSLMNATMDFDIRPQHHYASTWCVVRNQDIVRDVLESLCFVKTVTLGGWFIKAVSMCEAYNLSSPWSERRSLILCIPVILWDNAGIASLLHSSPYLENLEIRLSYCSDMCALEHASRSKSEVDYYWNLWNTISKCPLLHLKAVKVVGFRESCRSMKPLFKFLEFLLRNSRVLEEIAIQTSRYVTRGTLDEALKLLAAPTASPDAVVLFEPPHLWVDPLCMYQNSDPMNHLL